MCRHCDGANLLSKAGVEATGNRLAVLEALVRAERPLSTRDVLERVERGAGHMNRVTAYRILDLLAASGVLNRVAAPDRTDRYCLAAARHPDHAHFFCRGCGAMYCLAPSVVCLTTAERVALPESSTGQVEGVQVLLQGTCATCTKQHPETPTLPSRDRGDAG